MNYKKLLLKSIEKKFKINAIINSAGEAICSGVAESIKIKYSSVVIKKNNTEYKFYKAKCMHFGGSYNDNSEIMVKVYFLINTKANKENQVRLNKLKKQIDSSYWNVQMDTTKIRVGILCQYTLKVDKDFDESEVELSFED